LTYDFEFPAPGATYRYNVTDDGKDDGLDEIGGTDFDMEKMF
jgi:hypothetical protein